MAQRKFDEESEDFARRATPEEAEAASRFTASTHTFVNRAMHRGHRVEDLPELLNDGNSGITPEAIDLARKFRDLIRKAPLADAPRTLYRGVRAPKGMKPENLLAWAREKFKIGEPIHFGGFQHTSIHPKVGAAFTTVSDRIGVVFEMHTRKGAPLGKLSSRDESEGEYTLPDNERFVPVAVSEKVNFESMKPGTDGGPRVDKIVVHLVDVDDLDYYGLGHLKPDAPHTPGQPHNQPDQYGGQPDPYGSQPDPYGSQPDPYGSQPDPYGAAPESQPSGDGASSSGSADGQDWRPGDSGFGVTNKPGFDPAFHHKALGDEFAPSVHDPEGVFEPWERDIADRLEDEGWRVDARFRDDSKKGMKNPDSMVRKDPGDEGLPTEFKTPKSGGRNAIRRNINEASDQVPPDGEVVIDGRNVGLTRELADRAYGGAKGQPGKTVAARVHIILGDGQVVTYVKEN